LPKSDNKVYTLQLFTTLLFLSLFAFPLFPLKITNIIFILFALLTLITFIFKPVSIGKTIMHNMVFVLPFIPYLIELFVSGFDPAARFEFEKKLLFFTAPLIIPVFINVTKFKNYKFALLIFSLSIAALTIFSLLGLCIDGSIFNSVAYQNGAYILRNRFEDISGMHPTYYSIFALCTACFLFYQPYFHNRFYRFASAILLTILLTAILLLAVRIAIITGIVFVIIIIINKKISVIKKIILCAGTIILLVILTITLPSLKNRFGEISSWAKNETTINNTISQRETILNCSLNVFLKNILYGTGSRNFQKELNTCYSSNGWQTNEQRSFNPHNQFLSIGINYGIFILLTFLICLYFIFRKILKIPEAIFFAVAIIFVFLSESILERQMGVYFFVLISMLFYNSIESQTLKSSH